MTRPAATSASADPLTGSVECQLFLYLVLNRTGRRRPIAGERTFRFIIDDRGGEEEAWPPRPVERKP